MEKRQRRLRSSRMKSRSRSRYPSSPSSTTSLEPVGLMSSSIGLGAVTAFDLCGSKRRSIAWDESSGQLYLSDNGSDVRNFFFHKSPPLVCKVRRKRTERTMTKMEKTLKKLEADDKKFLALTGKSNCWLLLCRRTHWRCGCNTSMRYYGVYSCRKMLLRITTLSRRFDSCSGVSRRP